MPKTIAQRISALEKFVGRLLSAATHPGRGQPGKPKRPKIKRTTKAKRSVKRAVRKTRRKAAA